MSATTIKAYFHHVIELSSVHLEIEKEGKKFFISKDGKPVTFVSLEDAKHAALKAGASEGFIVLDKTYEEVDFNNDHDGHANHRRFDLIPTPLK